MPRALRLRMRLVRQYVKGGGHQCAQLLLTPRIAPPRIRAGLGPAGSLGKGTHSLRLAPSRARPSCITRFAQRRVWSVQANKRRAQLSASTRPSAGPLYPRPLRCERSERRSLEPQTNSSASKATGGPRHDRPGASANQTLSHTCHAWVCQLASRTLHATSFQQRSLQLCMEVTWHATTRRGMLPHNISDGGLSAVEWVNSFIHRFLRQIGPGMQPARAGLLELVVHLTVIRRKEGSSHSPHGIISHFLCSFLLCRTTARCVVAGCNIIDSMRPGNAARALDILQPAPSVARRMLRRGTSAGFWAFCDRSFSSAHAVRAVAALRSNGGAAPPNGLPPAWNAPAALLCLVASSRERCDPGERIVTATCERRTNVNGCGARRTRRSPCE